MQTRDLDATSLDEWRVAVSDAFVPLRAEAAPGPFRGRITAIHGDGVLVSTISADPHRAVRTPRLASASDSPFYKVSLQLTGTQTIVQDDHRVLLRPGDLSIYDSTRPYALSSTRPFRSLVLMFPRESLTVPTDAVASLTGTRLCGDAGVAALAARMLAHLADDLGPLATPAGARMTRTALDLVATAVAEQLAGLGDRGRTEHEHRTLALRVRGYIEAQLAEADLSPEAIAAAHFISVRHLQKVFKAEGQTVTGWIRERRLIRCADELVTSTATVSAVGARWGFPDAAHFSRVFKARFGVSPNDYRHGHRCP